MRAATGQSGIRAGLVGLVLLLALTGCGSHGYHRVQPTPLEQAQQEIPENLLLDVDVAIADAPELSEGKLEDQGTNEEIRRCESRYIPYHLKSTLQRSSYWGAVQVVPQEVENVDLKITSELIESNGEILRIKVAAEDASGRPWLERKYEARVSEEKYDDTVEGERDPFQDLYNTVANDLSGFLRSLTPAEIEEIRLVSKLEFARDFAPEAFGDYLAEDEQGRLVVQHLPADDDPIMERIDRMHQRDDMFVDTLNQYYEGFYIQMWDSYENWREYNLDERVALRQVQHEAFVRTLTGILMIAAAVALEVGDIGNTEAIGDILIMGGGQVVIGGINISQQAEIHAAAIEELGESFSAEMHPTIVELEGKQYELTGTAGEQYEHWKELLRRIYYEETGFETDAEGLRQADPDPVADPAGS